MSAILRLITLEAIKTRDPDGTDKIDIDVQPDSNGLGIAQTGVSEGLAIILDEEIFFDNIRRTEFEERVRIRIFHENSFSDVQTLIETKFVMADEAGPGRRKKKFEGEGAHYELTYEVLAG